MKGIVSNIIRTIKEIQFKMFILLEICWIDDFNAFVNVLPIEIKLIKLGEFRNMFCAVWFLNANFAWKCDPWKSNPNSSRFPPISWLFCTLETRSHILSIYNTIGYRRLLNKFVHILTFHYRMKTSNGYDLSDTFSINSTETSIIINI